MPQHRAYAQRLVGATESAAAAQGSRPGAAVGQRAGPAQIETIPWGLPLNGSDQRGTPACEIVAAFGEVEAEYAAIRRGAGLLDCPHRGTLVITGKERRDLLNRMLTQELKDLTAGRTREAFWLNRKGRIDADVFVIETGERMLLDLDVMNAAAAAKSLNEFIFAEEVEIRDASQEFHHVEVHGRLASETIAAASNDQTFDLAPGAAKTITIDGAAVTVARRDVTGEIGYALIVPREAASGVWEFVLSADHVVGEDKRRVRPIGWHAFNIARVEAGTPLFNIDFGPNNLPHETGVLKQRVSFTKGCYLGQEVVARMESRGHSKASLVGLRFKRDLLPVAGAQVFARNETGGMGEQIGAVTSSTLSPMLGAEPIAFASIRSAAAKEGSVVLVNAEGEQVEAVIAPLRFWPTVSVAPAQGSAT